MVYGLEKFDALEVSAVSSVQLHFTFDQTNDASCDDVLTYYSLSHIVGNDDDR